MARPLKVLITAIIVAELKLVNLDKIFPVFSYIGINVQLLQTIFWVLLTTVISAAILYFLSLIVLATKLFQEFWASLEEEY